MNKPKRLDLILLEKGLVPSRSKAQELIKNGLVQVLDHRNKKNQIVKSPGQTFFPDEILIEILENSLCKYVSRAGLKLDSALARLSLPSNRASLNISNFYVLDVGQSTGGFTDCLMQKGAARVLGIDVGVGQLHESLKKNSAIQFIENLNVKEMKDHPQFKLLAPEKGFDLIVVDVSFISLNQVLPFLVEFSNRILALVKPQFEVGFENIKKLDLIKDPEFHKILQNKMEEELSGLGFQVLDYFPSGLKGKEGNQEFFIYGEKK